MSGLVTIIYYFIIKRFRIQVELFVMRKMESGLPHQCAHWFAMTGVGCGANAPKFGDHVCLILRGLSRTPAPAAAGGCGADSPGIGIEIRATLHGAMWASRPTRMVRIMGCGAKILRLRFAALRMTGVGYGAKAPKCGDRASLILRGLSRTPAPTTAGGCGAESPSSSYD